MDYQKVYKQIIENARVREGLEYFEIHHIVPKCMGGSNDESNLVKLTLREHYIVHKLLHYIYPENKPLANAFWMMSNRVLNDENIHLTAREYEESRKAYIDSAKGKKRTEEQKRCISEATKKAMRKDFEIVQKSRVNKGSKWYRDKETGQTFKWFPGDEAIDLDKYEWGRSKMSDDCKEKISRFKEVEKDYFYIENLNVTYVAYRCCIKKVPENWVKGNKGTGAEKIRQKITDAARIFNYKTGYKFEKEIYFERNYKGLTLCIYSPAVYECCEEEIKNGSVEDLEKSLERNIKKIVELNKEYIVKTINDEEIINYFVKNGKIVSSRVNKNNIEKHPEYKEYLLNRYDKSEFVSYAFVIKRIIGGVEELPTCHYCGKKLYNLNAKWCNSSCQLKDKEFIQYRVEHTDYKALGEQIKNTCLEKYGVPGYFCLDEVHKKAVEKSWSAETKEKREKTIQEKYGVENVFQVDEFKEKSKITKLERYGAENYRNIEKYAENCMLKYGKSSYMETDEFKEKTKKTKIQKYGNEHYNNIDKIKQTMLDIYGVDNPAKLEKTKINSHSEEANEKRNETKRKNGTFNSSKPEQDVLAILENLYGESNVKTQYKSDKYPFNCDFYIVSEDLYIELNYHWTHGGHCFDKANIEDLNKVELWKSKRSQYYLNAIKTWTIRDTEKLKAFEQNNLNYVIFYNKENFETYISELNKTNQNA